MFISESEANKRLNSSENVLTVIDKDGNDRVGETHEQEPPVIIPDEILEAEDTTCASAKSVGMEPSGSLLLKMIGHHTGPGRQQGQKNMDPVIQAAVSVTAQLANTRTAAQTFGTSYHHADELKHGFTNQEARYGGKEPGEELQKEINHQKKVVRDLAFEKLTKALGLLDDGKLMSVTDPVKLARISKDLSTIHDKAMPKEERSDAGGVHFHIWRPEQRTEDSYEQVTVGGQR